jgi:ribosomal protein S18 acetylase RimI-like enzyme
MKAQPAAQEAESAAQEAESAAHEAEPAAPAAASAVQEAESTGLEAQPSAEQAQPVIRPAQPGDAAAMADVFIHAWRQAYPGVVPDAVLAALDHDQIARWLTELIARRAEGNTDVAERNGQVIGFVRYGTVPAEQASGYVFGLYVDPGAAGQGAGRALLRHAEQRLAEDGCETVALHVFEANERARRLYTRAGFRPDGSTRIEPEYQATEVRLVKVLSSPAEP